MKPIFTVHEGEFLVGEELNRRFGDAYDVWVPTKDSGVDLLVTGREQRRAFSFQVKFSRSFETTGVDPQQIRAGGWYTLDTRKVRDSRARWWVFVICTFRHERYFVVIPHRDLVRRIPRGGGAKWRLYLVVLDKGRVINMRGMKVLDKKHAAQGRRVNRRLDFSAHLDAWPCAGSDRRRK